MPYFEDTWLKRHKLAMWVKYACGPSIPSGDQSLKAWHHRLQMIVLSHQREDLKTLVLNLESEWTYHECLLGNPQFLQERLRK